ncbi:MAG: hypothetical protein XE11_0808 [Methanomicrobiales archaeon 53_19]|jgi:hypothetical protein|nr:MAG: hypothetical protein XD88_0013 [Methanocalculus sp. 52_23]KUL04083.1 MAG: hypothetical protein XE11_0808 [Methanomicrobiales archaeon 53_19]
MPSLPKRGSPEGIDPLFPCMPDIDQPVLIGIGILKVMEYTS